MSLNVERARDLFRGLHGEDPHAETRRQLIAPDGDSVAVRAQAIALLSAELLRNPFDLVSGDPPGWLLELSRHFRPGPTLLFDARLNALTARAVDDVVSQGVDPEVLVEWLESRRRATTTKAARSRTGNPLRPR